MMEVFRRTTYRFDPANALFICAVNYLRSLFQKRKDNMKLHDYLPRLFAIAAMNQFRTPRILLLEDEEPKPPVVGSAPAMLRKPLLTGRRGKGTRKQRKGLHATQNR